MYSTLKGYQLKNENLLNDTKNVYIQKNKT